MCTGIDVYQPTTIPSSEYYALEDLYNSTDGENWLWGDIALYGPHWFDDSPYPCSTPMWQGLNCSCVSAERSLTKSCHVTDITLDNYLLKGILPPSLNDLMELSTLSLGLNELNGTIPELLGNFSQLTVLDLRFNNYTGTIPIYLSKWSKYLLAVMFINVGSGNFVS